MGKRALRISDDVNDLQNIEFDPNVDIMEAKGLDILGAATHVISDDGAGNMIFTDPVAGGPWTLQQLLEDDSSAILPYSFFSSSGTPYLETSNSSYQVGAEIIWAGIDNVGAVENITIIAGSNSAVKQASFRVLDQDTGLVVAELAVTSSDRLLFDMGAISNVSNIPAIWEVQLKKDETGAKAQMSALLIATAGVN